MAKTSEGAGKGSRKESAPEDLADLKVPELRARAKELDISGVSGMKKDELIAAIGDAGGTAGGARGTGRKDSSEDASTRQANARDGADDGGAADDDTLRTLDEKFAEVLGLAQAAQQATARVAELVEDDDRRELLERMGREAQETAQRCTDALDAFGARRPAIEKKAGETVEEAVQMMQTYLGGEDVEALDGFEFLIMAEAGETGHWQVLQAMNEQAGVAVVRELADFAIPLQERHAKAVMDTALALASEEDPHEPA